MANNPTIKSRRSDQHHSQGAETPHLSANPSQIQSPPRTVADEYETNASRRKLMATYITLCNFTEKGAQAIKDTLKRTEAAKAAAKQFGATIKEVFWLQGQYDLIGHLEK